MRKLHVLLVEDNEGDILLTREGFEEASIPSTVSSIKDGWEAIQFLEKKGKYAESGTPDLVVLDINLPKMNGHEVLRQVKANPDTKHIPVVMFSTSSYDRDVRDSYEEHANCYISKPVDANEFVGAVTTLADFWFSHVTLPSHTL